MSATGPRTAAARAEALRLIGGTFSGDTGLFVAEEIADKILAAADAVDTRVQQPSLIDLVHELHTALHGSSWARPESPKAVWEMLLREVRALAEVATSCEFQGDGLCRQEGCFWPSSACFLVAVAD